MVTITEALAEIATIDKRLPKKIENMQPYVARSEAMKDPFEKDGGSSKYLKQERQSFGDLLDRKIALRRAIANSNAETMLTIDSETMSIADWLVWKRECYPRYREMLSGVLMVARNVRQNANRQGVQVINVGDQAKPEDIIINIDEQQTIKDLEAIEELYGKLDGMLSLKNATITIDV